MADCSDLVQVGLKGEWLSSGLCCTGLEIHYGYNLCSLMAAVGFDGKKVEKVDGKSVQCGCWRASRTGVVRFVVPSQVDGSKGLGCVMYGLRIWLLAHLWFALVV